MSCYYILRTADVAQSVERRLGKAEVTGPIPVISFFTMCSKASIYKASELFYFRWDHVTP